MELSPKILDDALLLLIHSTGQGGEQKMPRLDKEAGNWGSLVNGNEGVD